MKVKIQSINFTSWISRYSIWARGEQGRGVSINNRGPKGYASSGENPCKSSSFMLDNSSWGEKRCSIPINSRNIYPQNYTQLRELEDNYTFGGTLDQNLNKFILGSSTVDHVIWQSISFFLRNSKRIQPP